MQCFIIDGGVARERGGKTGIYLHNFFLKNASFLDIDNLISVLLLRTRFVLKGEVTPITVFSSEVENKKIVWLSLFLGNKLKQPRDIFAILR